MSTTNNFLKDKNSETDEVITYNHSDNKALKEGGSLPLEFTAKDIEKWLLLITGAQKNILIDAIKKHGIIDPERVKPIINQHKK